MAIARRDFLKYASGSLVSTAFLNSCRNSKSNDPNRPNIIVLIADDLRWDCIGRFNQIIQTPNLDRLGDRGTVYLNNFVTTSICPTSRASIFTGLYARSHAIWKFETDLNKKQWRNTYHHLIQKSGYDTAFIGKWGIGNNLPEKKFDYWGGFAEQGNYYTEDRQEHLTSYLTSQAEDFIDRQNSNFCLTVSYKAPHVDEDPDDPFIPDRKFARQYQDITVPRYGMKQDSDSLPDFLQHTEAQFRYAKRFQTDELYQNSVKNYYRLISGIDESIGRIVKAVKQQDFVQDTYLIFTSDNGFFLGEKGLAGKWFGFETAIRTPLIITNLNRPLPTAQTVNDMSLNIDLAPTILNLAKVEPEADLFQGQNIFPKQLEPRKWWFYEHLYEHPEINIPKNIGIRSLEYKYLFFLEQNYEMLFDLKKDSQENHNLAQNSDYSETIKHYRQLLVKAKKELSGKQ